MKSCNTLAVMQYPRDAAGRGGGTRVGTRVPRATGRKCRTRPYTMPTGCRHRRGDVCGASPASGALKGDRSNPADQELRDVLVAGRMEESGTSQLMSTDRRASGPNMKPFAKDAQRGIAAPALGARSRDLPELTPGRGYRDRSVRARRALARKEMTKTTMRMRNDHKRDGPASTVRPRYSVILPPRPGRWRRNRVCCDRRLRGAREWRRSARQARWRTRPQR